MSIQNGASNNLVGGTDAAARNIIDGGLTDEVSISQTGTTGNTVAGNYIGTDPTGTVAVGGTFGAGVLIQGGASGNIVGGSHTNAPGTAITGAGNLISYNVGGVEITGPGTNNNWVAGNYIGTDVTGTPSFSLENVEVAGVAIHGGAQFNVIGTNGDGVNDGAERNVISVNSAGDVAIYGSGTSQNVVAGNFIGTDATGAAAPTAPGNNGVNIYGGAQYNRIGVNLADADPSAERNVISGNYQGIELDDAGTSYNVVAGNYIGTDVTGTQALPNNDGVFIDNGPSNNTIGGWSSVDDTTGKLSAPGNVISGNVNGGVVIQLASGNYVQGNFIGTDATGTIALPNDPSTSGFDGVDLLDGASNNVIGGTRSLDGHGRLSGFGNLVSGNGFDGIFLGNIYNEAVGTTLTNNVVAGNFIGTDVTGTQALGNEANGIHFERGAVDNTIGGTTPGTANLISGNGTLLLTDYDEGIRIAASFGSYGPTTGNVVEGNLIGTDISGTGTLPNQGDGVLLQAAASNNLVGGTDPGAGNVIASNLDNGVRVDGTASLGNEILGNSIFANGLQGIVLTNGGNNLQAAPMLTAATFTATGLAIAGTLTSSADTTFTLEFFSNAQVDPSGLSQGQTFLGRSQVTSDGSGQVTFSAIVPFPPSGQNWITATATDASGNTSEFSIPINSPQVVPTTTIVSTSPNPSVFGQPVTVTAFISSQNTGAGTPAGTVTFTEGTTILAAGVPVDASGRASFTASNFAAGSHTIVAAFTGATGWLSSSGDDSAAPQVVNQAPTITTVTSSADPSAFGQSVIFTATVAGTGSSAAPAGSVQFVVDGSNFGGPIVLGTSGQAVSANISTLVVGTHAVTVNYISSDANFANSTGSLSGGQTVGKADTVTSLASSTNPSIIGQSVTLTATVTINSPGSNAVTDPTGTVTFYDGSVAIGTGTLTGTATDTATFTTSTLSVGSHTITATYASGDANFNASPISASVTQTVNKANTATTVISSVNPSVFGQTVTFTATVANISSGIAPSGGVEFFDGSIDLGAGAIGATSGNQTTWAYTLATLGAGDHTMTAVFNDDGGFVASSGTVMQTVYKADPAISITPYSVTYDGIGHAATGTATGVNGENLNGLNLSGTTHTNAGGYTDRWTFVDVTGNYNNVSGTVTDSIAKANATITVSRYSVTYDGTAHTATGSATGVQGENLTGLDPSTTTHTNAGTYTDAWTFADTTGNYNNATGTVTDSIAKANATITVSRYSVTYDGNAHTATGSATGVQGENLTGLDPSTTTHTNAGIYTDAWTFADTTGNYNNASGTVTDSIAKANATITVSRYSVTYDGTAHTATGSATGVQGENLAGLDLSATTRTNAGTYTDAWTFADTTGNYNNVSGTVTDSIAKANATITVSRYSVTYDGTAHTATGSATGVQGENLAGLDLSATTHTNAGTYTDAWTFADTTGNYNNASGTVTDSIAKANATITVSRYSVTYDGNAHTATGTVIGVKGESLNGLNLSATTRTNAGTYTDAWTFADTTGNYNNATGTVTDSIAKANATITVSRYSVTYDGNAHTATGTATGVKGESLNGLNLSATTHTNAGTYTDAWTFADTTGNYNNATGTVTDSIAKDGTITKVVSSAASVSFGQNFTLTATVSPNPAANTTPSGTADFFDATANTDLGIVALSGGSASLSESTLAVGSHTMTVTYNGNSNFLTSQGSTTVTIVVSAYVLNPTASQAFYAAGSAVMKIPGTLIVDSRSATAFYATGQAQVSAASINVVGGAYVGSNTMVTPKPTTGATAVTDPLASLAAPSVNGSIVSVNMSSGSLTINPGIYSSIKLAGTASLTMNPGIYVLAGGGLSVTQGASITGSGVLIYNAGSKYPSSGGNFGGITMSTSGTVSITAPASGTYAGVVIFQSRDNTRALTIGGASANGLRGTIYAAKALLTVTGTLQTALVVGTLQINTGANVTQMAVGSDGIGDTTSFAGTLLASHALGLGGSGDTTSPMNEMLPNTTLRPAMTVQDLTIPESPRGADPLTAANVHLAKEPVWLAAVSQAPSTIDQELGFLKLELPLGDLAAAGTQPGPVVTAPFAADSNQNSAAELASEGMVIIRGRVSAAASDAVFSTQPDTPRRSALGLSAASLEPEGLGPVHRNVATAAIRYTAAAWDQSTAAYFANSPEI